ncbi:dihydroxyacetone kinase [Psychromonas sp. CNPT3]|uniref:dihydroxyacetone kinase subunit DhaK n=1 Tax=Psychromonas sp. CNPT3 TaxID=314282 RepID=UPI0002C12610|nr:dihydroxyacetone kinase subunit DhaK [Psychromonas sp. CNPT3]AGH82399.1 dihydroxyacetone kinase [Psychromonas sp. CNPT3]
MSRLFINDKATLVHDAIDGILYSNKHNNLVRLDVDPQIRIVTRNDWHHDKVAIISGGGSGHEPAHVGFIGKGMLTAAVCGDVFASPSVDAVLNAIVHVTGEKGCLVIVKNYTGDRLNFGLACEKAKKMGLNVEMVIVDDDISIPDNLKPRGIAGTLFVHKVAGNAAEQGASLNVVKKAAQGAIDATASIGLALTSCSLPGEESTQRIAEGKAELGLGIHGEPGIKTIDVTCCRDLVMIMVDKLKQSFSAPDIKIAVMINNLGGVSPLEMSLICKDIVESELKNNIELVVGPAPFMTAIDMKGFSISVIELTGDHAQALCAPVEVDAWVEAIPLRPLNVIKKDKVSINFAFEASENAQVASIVKTVTLALINAEKELNRLDTLVGDGDTGSTFSAGARQVLAELNAGNLPLNDTGALLNVIGEQLATVMGGSSGVLFSIFFTAAGHHYQQHGDTVQALQAGLQQMMQYGGAKPGDRTMIDAMYPAFIAWKNEGFEAAIVAAKIGAESTATMVEAKAGRSSYLNSESLKGVKDPGSVAVELVFDAFNV